MAGYRQTFGANVDYAYGRGTSDIASSLQRGVAALGNSGLGGFIKQSRDANRAVKDLTREIERLDGEFAFANTVQQFRSLNRQIEDAERNLKKMKDQARNIKFDAMERGIGKVTKGLIGLNASILGLSFDFLIDSIKRVYELQERWTKAIGGFNMKIGGTTAGLSKMTKAAVQLSGQLRGLTDGDISEAIEGFAEFNDALGSTTDKSVEFAKTSLQLSRGFNLGWSGAGKLTKTFVALGNDVGDANDVMKNLVKASNASGVSVNMVAKDVAESSTYMARFGKENQKTFVQGAAYARKYGIAIGEVQKAVEGLDMFDEAAKTASKLNTAFGTMINSMDLMMEDDPAKRLEMIRQQFLAQGTTFEKLSPKQRRYLSETLRLTEEQTAALLSAKNANQSYADMQEKAAKREKNELNAKQMMEKQLRATAQTMYAFGAAFDRITVAIANAIKPLLEVFGLAKDGDKKFTSFGQVMESVTKTVEEFFNSLAKNEKWKSFMRELAKDLIRAGRALKEFVMSGGAADLVGDIAKGMKGFYTTVRDLAVKAVPALRPLLSVFLTLSSHIKELVIAWGALKFTGMIGTMAGGAGGIMGGLTAMGGGGKGMRGQFAGRLGTAGVGAAAGGMLGGTGGAIGGGIGGMLGPMGAALGAVIGSSIQHLFNYFTKNEALEEIRKEAQKAEADRVLAAQKQTASLEGLGLQQKRTAQRQLEADQLIDRAKKGKFAWDEKDVELLKERVSGLRGFGKQTELVNATLSALNKHGYVSRDMLKALSSAQEDQRLKFESLTRSTQALIAADEKRLDFAMDEIKVAGLKNQQAKADIEIQSLEEKKNALKSGFNAKDPFSAKNQKLLEEIKKVDEEIGKANIKKQELALAMSKKQADIGEKHYLLDLRRALFEDPLFKAFAAQQNFKNDKGEIDVARAMSVWAANRPNEFEAALAGADLDKSTRAKLIASLPHMAAGGVVTRPTVALIGEDGPEAVIPLSRRRENFAGSTGGNGSTQTIVTQIAEVHLDGVKVGRALVRSAVTGRN